MHQVLVDIRASLMAMISRLDNDVPSEEPFGNVHGNWSFPGLTKSELIEQAEAIVDAIEENELDEVGEDEVRLRDYVRRIDHLTHQTVPNIWGSPGAAVPAYLSTLEGLRRALGRSVYKDDAAAEAVKLRRLAVQVRSLEARLKSIEPKTISIEKMVFDIERAHATADQLPTDLESLAEARRMVAKALSDASGDQAAIATLKAQSVELEEELKASSDTAKSVLERCETAYSAATSVGLAAAFGERSSALSKSMWIWVGGLAISLVLGGFLGSNQLGSLSKVLSNPSSAASVVSLNLLLTLVTVGGPVWFAWISTKQIGQRFRLAEDYAFKASVSRAYEGFRREAARFDKEMEAKLLGSALSRFDELPLRLIETESHGSPWHELASSKVVKEALRSVPNFAAEVIRRAEGAVSSSRRPAGENPRRAKEAQDEA